MIERSRYLSSQELTEEVAHDNALLQLIAEVNISNFNMKIGEYQDIMEHLYANKDSSRKSGYIKLKDIFTDVFAETRGVPIDFNMLQTLDSKEWELIDVKHTRDWQVNHQLETDFYVYRFEHTKTAVTLLGISLEKGEADKQSLPTFFLLFSDLTDLFDSVFFEDYLYELVKIDVAYNGATYMVDLLSSVRGNQNLLVGTKDHSTDCFSVNDYDINFTARTGEKLLAELKEYIIDQQQTTSDSEDVLVRDVDISKLTLIKTYE